MGSTMAAYFSEVGYQDNPQNFFEVAVPAGTDVSGYSIAIYNGSGVLKGTMAFPAPDATLLGHDVYSFDEFTPGGVQYGASEAIALIDDTGTVVQFVSFEGKTVTPSTGPAAGETSTSLGFLNSGQTFETTDDGASYYAQSAPNRGTIPCYAPGTMIDTPDGPRAVETLRAGDLVLTMDHGPRPIRWVRSGDHPLNDVGVDGKPVLIKAGALGAGRPTQDLIVSPQHRILVGGGGQLMQFFETEAFVPAKTLTGVPGIRHMKSKARITWIHFACDRHEVVMANGCLSESLLLGPMVLNLLTRGERRALMGIFETAVGASIAVNGPAARTCLKVAQVQRQIANGASSNGSHAAKESRNWDRDAAMAQYEAERLRA